MEPSDSCRHGPGTVCPNCSTAARPGAILNGVAGSLQFPGYEVLGPIGQGGWAVVYKARDTSLNRVVAIKTPRATLDAGELEQFKSEARKQAGLNHENIVTVHSFCDGSPPFLVMEHVEGGTLAERIKEKAVGEEDAVEIALQLLGALKHLHGRDLIHRDIKPSNVFARKEGRRWHVKLADFGIAKGVATALTRPGSVCGTVIYMAPEQLEGHACAQSDLYSVGVVLGEMLLKGPMDLTWHSKSPTWAQALLLRPWLRI